MYAPTIHRVARAHIGTHRPTPFPGFGELEKRMNTKIKNALVDASIPVGAIKLFTLFIMLMGGCDADGIPRPCASNDDCKLGRICGPDVHCHWPEDMTQPKDMAQVPDLPLPSCIINKDVSSGTSKPNGRIIMAFTKATQGPNPFCNGLDWLSLAVVGLSPGSMPFPVVYLNGEFSQTVFYTGTDAKGRLTYQIDGLGRNTVGSDLEQVVCTNCDLMPPGSSIEADLNDGEIVQLNQF